MISKLREQPSQMLIVYDEYGHFEGIITPINILQSIAGGFSFATNQPDIIERSDGSLLVSGWMPVDEFAVRTGIVLEEHPSLVTVAGLVLDRAATIPSVADHFDIDGWTLEIVKLDGRRIDRLLAVKLYRGIIWSAQARGSPHGILIVSRYHSAAEQIEVASKNKLTQNIVFQRY